MKNNKIKSKIKKEHIKKISKVDSIEDLFVLTTNFKKTDNEKLIKEIKKEAVKNKEINEEIKSLIKKTSDEDSLKNNITEQLIEKMNNKLQNFKEKCTEKRKKGEDVLVADLKIMFLQYKLKLFNATKDKRDYLKIKKVISEIERLIN